VTIETVASEGRRVRPDDGFATVWVVTAMALVAVATVAAIGYGAATFERHRASAAADAAALAIALEAVQGPAVACGDGASLARLDGATVTRCELQGSVADVEVSVHLPGPLGRFGSATGRARAGPASLGCPIRSPRGVTAGPESGLDGAAGVPVHWRSRPDR
jgi:secretion/DNA translocation related TadE-like protein